MSDTSSPRPAPKALATRTLVPTDSPSTVSVISQHSVVVAPTAASAEPPAHRPTTTESIELYS